MMLDGDSGGFWHVSLELVGFGESYTFIILRFFVNICTKAMAYPGVEINTRSGTTGKRSERRQKQELGMGITPILQGSQGKADNNH